MLYFDYFSMYLGEENSSKMIVSIKEIPMSHMGKISEELFVYKELEAKDERVEGLLALYQTQIDFNSYLLIKEPYSMTLDTYLLFQPSIS